MYYVLGKEREGGKKKRKYHVYEITMEKRRAAEAVESLMEFDKSTAPAGKPSNMAYKVIETDADEFFFDDFQTFDICEKLKNLKDNGELAKDCVINFNDKFEFDLERKGARHLASRAKEFALTEKKHDTEI